MHLISLDLTNFGKHKKLSQKFEKGVTVIRGSNEAGKTTAILGWMYNWFGASMLEYPVEEYINRDGAKTFRTETQFEVRGTLYTCSRGPAGAELSGSDGLQVTNHGPVTAKIEELLGIPAGKAATTIYAAQNEIRGVLSLGPTAAAEYIEKMADFSEIDALIRWLAENLQTGSVKPFQEQLEQKKSALESTAEVVFDPSELEGRITSLEAEKESLQKSTSQLAAQIESAKVLNQANEQSRQNLTREISEKKKSLADRQRLETAAAGIDDLRKQAEEIDQQIADARMWQIYSEFQSLPKPAGGAEWDGNLETLSSEQARLQDEYTSISGRIREIDVLVKGKERERLTSTICPITKKVCGELSDPALIEKTNTAINQEIARLQKERSEISGAGLQEIAEDQQVIRDILDVQAKLEKWIGRNPGLVEVNDQVVPWALSWGIDVPQSVVMPTEASGSLWDRVRLAETAAKQLEVVPACSAEDLERLEGQLRNLPERVDTNALDHNLIEERKRLSGIEAQITTEKQTLKQQREAADAAKWARQSFEKEIAGLGKTITEVEKNNDLIKNVRAGRLKVTDLLWSKVLGGTSNYFSAMRGAPSVVGRSPKGFVINGGRVVSGSTQDLLGLALRVAMVKMFSQCGILLLDEANAGADAQRSSAITGTLSGSGFDQVVLITHKDVDEAGCDSLIEL